VLYLVEQPPHYDLLRLSLSTDNMGFVCKHTASPFNL